MLAGLPGNNGNNQSGLGMTGAECATHASGKAGHARHGATLSKRVWTMKELLFIAAGFACLAASGAEAQNRNCADHETVVSRLADRWGESRQSIGLAANNSVVEVFASLETGTWTITVTQPGGPTCLVASGEAFQFLAEALPNTDAPA